VGSLSYYIYTDMERGKPTSLGYATGKSPLGPFEYRGIIIDNVSCDPQSWNNHGSIECFRGQWYVFYHRCCGNSQLHRRLCVEKIQFRSDGSIPEIKMTSQGLGEPFGPGEKIMGYQACELSGSVFIGVEEGQSWTEEHIELLTGITPGDEMAFRYVKNSERWKKIIMKVSGTGRLQLLMNGKNAGEIDLGTKTAKRIEETPVFCEHGEYELRICALESKNICIYDLILE
jgi:hypothetical protein